MGQASKKVHISEVTGMCKSAMIWLSTNGTEKSVHISEVSTDLEGLEFGGYTECT